MPQFEVFIPPNDRRQDNLTLQIKADNWMDALRTGLVKIGEDQSALSNVMCDVQPDNSIHVSEPGTKRVFRLRQLDGETQGVSERKRQSGPNPRAGGPSQAPPPKTKAPPPQRSSGQFAEAPKPTSSTTSLAKQDAPKIGRSSFSDTNVEDAISDVFESMQTLMEQSKPEVKEICEFMLDLALKHVPAKAGTFFLADINAHALTFEAVRGPKSETIKNKKLTVPVGQGVVGFAAQEGICLVIEDMQNDTRYFSAISEAIGQVPRNSLCASAELDGRLLGAIQLIDRQDGAFTAAEMEVVRYIGMVSANLLERSLDA